MKKVILLVIVLVSVQISNSQTPYNMADTIWTKFIPVGVSNVMFSKDDSKILTNYNGYNGSNGGLMIIDAKTGKTDTVINGFYMGLLSTDKLKSYTVQDGVIKELDMVNFTTIREFEKIVVPVTTISVTNDKYITARNQGGMGFSIWDIESGKLKDSVHLGMSNTETRTIEAVQEILLTPDYKILLVRMAKWVNPIMPYDPQITTREHLKIMNAETKEIIKEIDSVGGLYLSKTGKYFICISPGNNFGFEFRVFETSTLNELFRAYGFPSTIKNISFTENDRYMAVSHELGEGKLDIWDIETKKRVYQYFSFGKGGGQSSYSSSTFSKSSSTICATDGYDIFLYKTPWITDVEEHTNTINATIIYPNPATSNATIEFMLNQANDTKINIIDLSGKIIKNVFSNFLNEGQHKININLQDILPGNYYLQINSGKNFYSQKISIMR